MADFCILCEVILSNHYLVKNPNNLPEMPCCVCCEHSQYTGGNQFDK